MVATLSGAFFFELQPTSRASLVVAILIGSYAALYALEFLWNLMFKAPVAIVSTMDGDIATLRALEAKPKRTPAQQHLYDKTKAALERGDSARQQTTREALRHLHTHRELSTGQQLVEFAHAKKIDSNAIFTVLNQLAMQDGVVTLLHGKTDSSTWKLPEGMNAVLDELLYKDGEESKS